MLPPLLQQNTSSDGRVMNIESAAPRIRGFHKLSPLPRDVRMHEWQKSPSRAPLRRESNSPLFLKASRVKLIQGLLAPLRPTTTYVLGSASLPRFHSPLCSKSSM